MSPLPAAVDYQTILVPLDGSTVAESVMPIAGALAKATAARVHLVRAHEPPRMAMAKAYEWNREVAQRELDYLAVAAGRFERGTGVSAETCLVTGRPADAICRMARRDEKTLVVMSSHGRTGFSRFWLGSVADAVVRGARTPVLVVRPMVGADEAARRVERVLVPLDGSEVAESVLPHAAWLCKATGASLQLVHVIRPAEIPHVDPALQEDATQAAIRDAEGKLRSVARRMCTQARETPIDCVVLLHDSPAIAINEYAAANAGAAIALTPRGAGLARLVGSVADKVIRDGPRMVRLFRPPETDAPAITSPPIQ
jgi:nucleotide-binding universal stress UspA family protein